MNAKELMNYGEEQLASHGIADAKVDSQLLYCHITGTKRSRLFFEYQNKVGDHETGRYKELIRRRCSGEPLQYITGKTEFMGLPFYVDERVLIPRQETELLVEKALELLKGKAEEIRRHEKEEQKRNLDVADKASNQAGDLPRLDVLDCCCGSGAIGLSVLELSRSNGESGLPLEVRATCTDISEDALDVARKNADLLGLSSQGAVTFLKGNLLEPVSGKQFDLILCNPPYIPARVIPTLQREVREHEPMLALEGGEDGISPYRVMAPQLGEHLNPGGFVLFEIGHDQGEAVPQLLRDTGDFGTVKVLRDFTGRDRIVLAQRA